MAISQHDFSVRFTRSAGAVVIDVVGELDVYTSQTLRQHLADVIDDQGSLFVIVQLTHVTFIDSTALGVLVGAHRRLRDRGGELRLSNPTSTIYKALELTGLTREMLVTRT